MFLVVIFTNRYFGVQYWHCYAIYVLSTLKTHQFNFGLGFISAGSSLRSCKPAIAAWELLRTERKQMVERRETKGRGVL